MHLAILTATPVPSTVPGVCREIQDIRNAALTAGKSSCEGVANFRCTTLANQIGAAAMSDDTTIIWLSLDDKSPSSPLSWRRTCAEKVRRNESVVGKRTGGDL